MGSMGSIGNSSNSTGIGWVGQRGTDFTSYSSVDNTVNLPAFGEGSERGEIQEQLNNRIKEAENLGFEIVKRPYQTKGRDSGKYYDWTEREVELPVKSSNSGRDVKIANQTNLGKHIQNVKEQYEDVIVLASKPVLPYTKKGRRGFNTTYKATFVVMGRRRK